MFRMLQESSFVLNYSKQGSLTKAPYSWPLCTNNFRLAAFDSEHIIYFFYKTSYLVERQCFGHHDTQHNGLNCDTQHCHYAECCVLLIVIRSVVMISVVVPIFWLVHKLVNSFWCYTGGTFELTYFTCQIGLPRLIVFVVYVFWRTSADWLGRGLLTIYLIVVSLVLGWTFNFSRLTFSSSCHAASELVTSVSRCVVECSTSRWTLVDWKD